MIRGLVNARREAVVPLRVRGSEGPMLEVRAIVDSGFTGSLTLPIATVDALSLDRISVGGAVMADGIFRPFDLFAAEVSWEGHWKPVLVSCVGDEVLLGMELLVGSELRIAVVPGGIVEIGPLP